METSQCGIEQQMFVNNYYSIINPRVTQCTKKTNHFNSIYTFFEIMKNGQRRRIAKIREFI